MSAQPCSLASSSNDAEFANVLLQLAALDLCGICQPGNVNATVSFFVLYRILMTTELLIRPINSEADWERLKHCQLGRLCRLTLVKVVMTFDSNWGRQCVLEF